MMLCSHNAHTRTRVQPNCTHEDRVNSWNGTDCCRPCYDQARRDDEAEWARFTAETDACPACDDARHRHFDHQQRTTTIDPSEAYGQHILILCRNHPDLRWHTKNIDYIGARSIFFVWAEKAECTCPAHDLFSPGRFLYKLCYLLGTDNAKPYERR